MIDPKQDPSRAEEEAAERKPELESETLKDLAPSEGEGEVVKGGDTGIGRNCETGTA